MKTRAVITFGLTALVLGGTVVGCSAGQRGIASAGSKDAARATAAADVSATEARKALAAGRYADAVRLAEAAVGGSPQAADYRMLLGQSYLKSGRFASARQSFADVVALQPGNGKAALNLALMQIATGDWAGARQTLDGHATTIAASDRGLAIALAGDPAAAIAVLDVAAHAPEADAKTRQNLALSLALAGRWQDAKTLIASDIAPDEVDTRILQWAQFAKPASAADQVATLLGVTPVVDAGQPVALALTVPDNLPGNATALAATTLAPIDTFMPGAPPEGVAVAAQMGTPVGEAEAQVGEARGGVAPVVASVSAVSFAARQEVAQAVPARADRAPKTKAAVASGATKAVPALASVTTGTGNYFVQLGAFENAAVARDAWTRMTRKHASFASHTPSGMPVSTKAGHFYRLSVGGFTRADANALCQTYKASGGICFVRVGAGDKIATWVKGGAVLAAR